MAATCHTCISCAARVGALPTRDCNVATAPHRPIFRHMPDGPAPLDSRARRVWKNLRQGLELVLTASPAALVRLSVLGMIGATLTPIQVFLGARLVNQIAQARAQGLSLHDIIPTIVGLWLATGV